MVNGVDEFHCCLINQCLTVKGHANKKANSMKPYLEHNPFFGFQSSKSRVLNNFKLINILWNNFLL